MDRPPRANASRSPQSRRDPRTHRVASSRVNKQSAACLATRRRLRTALQCPQAGYSRATTERDTMVVGDSVSHDSDLVGSPGSGHPVKWRGTTGNPDLSGKQLPL